MTFILIAYFDWLLGSKKGKFSKKKSLIHVPGISIGPSGSNWCFYFAPELVGYSAPRDLHRRAAYSILFLIHQDVYHDLFVCS